MMDTKRIEIPGTCEDPACRGPVSVNTLCCIRCGVSHSEPCPGCGRFGFHREDCIEMQEPPTGPMKFRIVCAGCELVLEPGTPGADKSHSICRDCWKIYTPEIPYPEGCDGK
jgi:hypothetical protein